MMDHDYVRHVNKGIKNEYVLQCGYRSSSNVAQHNDFCLESVSKGDRPTTICAGSKVCSVISATLGIEGGFKANVLLLSIVVFQRRGVHTLITGEEIIHRYFRCHVFCLSSDVVFPVPTFEKRQSHNI